MNSTTDVLSQSVVVFSRNYLPISRVNIKRAIALLIEGKAEPLEIMASKAWPVRSPSLIVWVPEQIRLTCTGGERLWKIPAVNRREVLRRDKQSCQYCGSTKSLTLDHVMPRSRGGKHSWDNVVTACSRCNALKGDRTPAEAKMPLYTQPKAPIHPAVAFAEQFWRDTTKPLE